MRLRSLTIGLGCLTMRPIRIAPRATHQHPVDGGVARSSSRRDGLDPALLLELAEAPVDGRPAVPRAFDDPLESGDGTVAVPVGGVSDGDEHGTHGAVLRSVAQHPTGGLPAHSPPHVIGSERSMVTVQPYLVSRSARALAPERLRYGWTRGQSNDVFGSP